MSDIQQAVREHSGAIATDVREAAPAPTGCCGPTCCAKAP
jgi:hypothetical protein